MSWLSQLVSEVKKKKKANTCQNSLVYTGDSLRYGRYFSPTQYNLLQNGEKNEWIKKKKKKKRVESWKQFDCVKRSSDNFCGDTNVWL